MGKHGIPTFAADACPQRQSALARIAAGEPDDIIYSSIDAWHDGDGAIPLHEWLGMAELELAEWTIDHSRLTSIVAAYKKRVSGRQ